MYLNKNNKRNHTTNNVEVYKISVKLKSVSRLGNELKLSMTGVTGRAPANEIAERNTTWSGALGLF